MGVRLPGRKARNNQVFTVSEAGVSCRQRMPFVAVKYRASRSTSRDQSKMKSKK